MTDTTGTITADEILAMAHAIVPDADDREAALRTVAIAWDPRTGLDGLRNLFRSFAPLGGGKG